MKSHTQILKDYLSQNGIYSREASGELITHCLINNCDQDSRGHEAHFYISVGTTQFNCKKCGESGNIFSLSKILKDRGDSFIFDELKKGQKPKNPRFSTIVENNHNKLPDNIRKYLNEVRGWSDYVINQKKIGWVQQWGTNWIGFPIKDEQGKYQYYKLRENYVTGRRKLTSEKDVEAQIYDWETLNLPSDTVVICEGEGDCLLLLSLGVNAVTNTHGAGTFKNEWLQYFPKDKTYYIAYDRDEAGLEGRNKVAGMLNDYGIKKIFIVNLPSRLNIPSDPEADKRKVDITDYFIEMKGTVKDLFDKYATEYPEKVDTTKFKSLTAENIGNILDLTIKKDDINKVTTFLCQLSAYTEENQFNISFQAPSSSGKSHIPLEVSNLFPKEDVLKLGNCSPTAFFHEQGVFDKEGNEMRIDLSRKILIFLDMPHSQLLERLRPLLSHDEKEMKSKITDKSQKGGNKTKTVVIVGYPSVIFCTAGLTLDEQEATRFLLLSPETSQEKIREGIKQVIRKGINKNKYDRVLTESIERQLLVERIRAIRQEKIQDIQIESEEKIEQRYLDGKMMFKPKHQRDVKRLLSLVKAFALLNLWWRERNEGSIVANDDDINEAFKLWNKISESQELNLPPYVFNLFNEVVLDLWLQKNKSGQSSPVGLSRKDITQKHTEVYGRRLPPKQLSEDLLPLLEDSGLIYQQKDQRDERMWLVYVIDDSTKVLKEEFDKKVDEKVQADIDFNEMGTDA